MPTQTLTISASYKALRAPAEVLRAMLATAGVADDLAARCELALQELLANLVDHAYQGDASRSIEITLTVEGHLLTIRTFDTGTPATIDLDRVHMPAPSDLAESGYGMALINFLMDQVSYQAQDGVSTWTLVKDLNEVLVE